MSVKPKPASQVPTQQDLKLFEPVRDLNKLAAFYQKLREFPYFFDGRVKDNPYRFSQILAAESSRAFELGDFGGIIYFTNITPKGNAFANIAIWDEELLGRPELGVAAGLAVARAFDLHRLDATIIELNTPAITYATKLGFQHEGTIREVVWYNDHWENLVYLGVLRDEMEGVATNGRYVFRGQERSPTDPTGA